MSNHHEEKFDGGRGAYLKVGATRGRREVEVFAFDISNDVTFNTVTPDQARDIARSLQDAATLAEKPAPKVGDTIVTEEEMKALPEWTILRSRGRVPYHREDDQWLSELHGGLSSEVASSVGRPFTILYLPEEAM